MEEEIELFSTPPLHYLLGGMSLCLSGFPSVCRRMTLHQVPGEEIRCKSQSDTRVICLEKPLGFCYSSLHLVEVVNSALV